MRYERPGIVALAMAIVAAEAAGKTLPRPPLPPEPPKPEVPQCPLSRQARRKAERQAAKRKGGNR